MLSKILDDLVTWCIIQFNALGFKKEASQLALNLVSSLQGAYLLAQIFKEPTMLKKQVEYTQAWLEQLILEARSIEQAIA